MNDDTSLSDVALLYRANVGELPSSDVDDMILRVARRRADKGTHAGITLVLVTLIVVALTFGAHKFFARLGPESHAASFAGYGYNEGRTRAFLTQQNLQVESVSETADYLLTAHPAESTQSGSMSASDFPP